MITKTVSVERTNQKFIKGNLYRNPVIDFSYSSEGYLYYMPKEAYDEYHRLAVDSYSNENDVRHIELFLASLKDFGGGEILMFVEPTKKEADNVFLYEDRLVVVINQNGIVLEEL